MGFSGTNTNYPTALDLEKMIGSLNSNYSIVKGCRFIVRINLSGLLTQLSYVDQVKNHMMYACEAAEFPGRGFDTASVRYYGPKQTIPGNTIYGDGLNLTFMCRSKSLERQLMDDWMDIINPPNSYHFRFPDQYYTTIEIFQYAEFGSPAGGSIKGSINGQPRTSNPTNKFNPEPIYAWKFNKAWPVMVAPQPVTWMDQDILRLQVTFAYKNWSRHGDTEKINSKITM